MSEIGDALRMAAQAALPPVEGELRLPGLHGRVEVVRDRWGVPHIYAQDEHDLFFAQGFVVAVGPTFQLEFMCRAGPRPALRDVRRAHPAPGPVHPHAWGGTGRPKRSWPPRADGRSWTPSSRSRAAPGLPGADGAFPPEYVMLGAEPVPAGHARGAAGLRQRRAGADRLHALAELGHRARPRPDRGAAWAPRRSWTCSPTSPRARAPCWPASAPGPSPAGLPAPRPQIPGRAGLEQLGGRRDAAPGRGSRCWPTTRTCSCSCPRSGTRSTCPARP